MLNKRKALSTMGFAIIFVIILGVVMIISAPMMADKYKDKTPSQTPNNVENNRYEERRSAEENVEPNMSVPDNISSDEYRLKDMENRIMSQIDYKIREEVRNNIPQTNSSVSDKYVCTIEGYLDNNGTVVPLNSGYTQDRADQAKVSDDKKFVFVCQYRR